MNKERGCAAASIGVKRHRSNRRSWPKDSPTESGLCVKTMLAVASNNQNGFHPAGHARAAQPSMMNHERHELHEKTLSTKRRTIGIHAPPARHQRSNGKTVGEREDGNEANPRDNRAPSPAPSPQIARRCAAESRLILQGFNGMNQRTISPKESES